MGAFYQSKDGSIEIRPGVKRKVMTSAGPLNAVVEGVYGISVPFEIEVVENPGDPVETPHKAGDYLLVRVLE